MKSLCLLLCALLLGACSASPPAADGSNPVAAGPPVRLPAPLALEGIATRQRSAAGDSLQLLSLDYILASDEGATPQPGSLVLTPPEGGTAWAVYDAAGLQPGGEVVPSSLLTIFNKPVYIAVADFNRNRWQWVRRGSVGSMLLDDGASLVSPGGRVYVAALAWQQEVVLSSLQLNFSGTVPASPTAVANAPGQVTSGYPMQYSATGSTAGSGALVTAVTYDFGDGSGKQVTDDPLLPVEHTYAAPGSYEFTVTIDNDLGYSATDSILLEVTEGFTELLVVANSDDPDSMELADYYMSPTTGRAIHPQRRLDLPLGSGVGETVTRSFYEDSIREPIRGWIADRGLVDTLRYIVLLKGVPHRISGADNASVDSELCLINEDPLEGGGYPKGGWIYSGPGNLDTGTGGFYDSGEAQFSPNTFTVSHDPTYEDPGSGDETEYTLSYLVGRISAYTYEEAHDIIDRSLQADTSGTGWAVIDSSNGNFAGNPQNLYDTMVDSVFIYPGYSYESLDSLEELLVSAGMNVFADVTTERIISGSASLPGGFSNSVIAYTGWGVNHSGGSWPNGNEYILKDLGWDYLPGACFMSYESYNGWDHDDSDGITRNGQGQICDFLRMGGTVAIGNAWEPYTIGVGDERIVMSRYLVEGDNWIESTYKGLRLLSWMEVVVGDPLCKVK